MAQGKVEICGVNTAKLPILNEEGSFVCTHQRRRPGSERRVH